MKHFEYAISDAQHAKLKHQWPDLVAKAAEAGVFIGPDGRVNGKVVGSVRLSATKLEVDVESKPFFLSWDRIESTLRELFS